MAKEMVADGIGGLSVGVGPAIIPAMMPLATRATRKLVPVAMALESVMTTSGKKPGKKTRHAPAMAAAKGKVRQPSPEVQQKIAK